MAGQEVKGGDLIVLPHGETLALPKLGAIVWVAFPTRAWLCPAMVVTAASPRDPQAKIGVMVFNKHTFPGKVHHREGVPHTTQGNGEQPVWYWPR